MTTSILEITPKRRESIELGGATVEEDVCHVLYSPENGEPEWALGMSPRQISDLFGFSEPRKVRARIQAHIDELSPYLTTRREVGGPTSPEVGPLGKAKDLHAWDACRGAANADDELILFGPGLDKLAMFIRKPKARDFRDWLSRRSYELRTRGVAFASPPLTTADPKDQLVFAARQLLAMAEGLRDVSGRVDVHDDRLDEHSEQIAGNTSQIEFLSDIVVRDKRRVGGIARWVRSVLRADFEMFGCCVCRSKVLGFQVCHIEARGRGGSDDITNLFAGCTGCNYNRTPEDQALRRNKEESYMRDPRSGDMAARYRNLAEGESPLQRRFW